MCQFIAFDCCFPVTLFLVDYLKELNKESRLWDTYFRPYAAPPLEEKQVLRRLMEEEQKQNRVRIRREELRE